MTAPVSVLGLKQSADLVARVCHANPTLTIPAADRVMLGDMDLLGAASWMAAAYGVRFVDTHPPTAHTDVRTWAGVPLYTVTLRSRVQPACTVTISRRVYLGCVDIAADMVRTGLYSLESILPHEGV